MKSILFARVALSLQAKGIKLTANERGCEILEGGQVSTSALDAINSMKVNL